MRVFFYGYAIHRDRERPTPSLPTRRSSYRQRDAAPAIEPHPQDRGFSDSACARPSPSVLLLFSCATNPWSIVPSLMAKPSPLSVRRSSEDPDRKSTSLTSSHYCTTSMPSPA